MTTECTIQPIVLQAGNDRTLVGQFNGGTICSDGGAILLRQVEQATGIIRQFASCFTDHRNPDLIDHTLYELICLRFRLHPVGTMRRECFASSIPSIRSVASSCCC